MKPVVEGMGLDWSYQFRKIKSHPVLSKGVAVIAIPSDGGDQDNIALPLTRLNFWLATVHPDRIRDAAIRDRVLQYQTECADALFAHFFGDAVRAFPEAARKPMPCDPAWAAWLSMSTDERRTRRYDAQIYGQAYGLPGMRYAMFQVGMPVLPDYLLGAREQYELALAQEVGVTVTVSQVAR